MVRNGRSVFQFLSPFNPRQHGGWTGWSEGGLRPPAAAPGGFRGGGGQRLQAQTRSDATHRLTRSGVKTELLYTAVNLLQLMLSDVDSH